jgi:hypothetical protein
MSILKKLTMILGGNLRILKQQFTQSPNNSVRACARHPEHKATGVCKYCERELCSDCLIQKKRYSCCSNKDDCLHYLERYNDSKAEQVRKIFKEFSARPNAQVIDQLITLVKDSADPEITSAILETFDFETKNLGVFGLALHCLGLVRDRRALEYLIEQFDALSNAAAQHPDPQVQAICADHSQRVVLSIINLISTGRESSPKAIPYIIKIYESDFFPAEIKALALYSLRILGNSHTSVQDYYQKEFKKHA